MKKTLYISLFIVLITLGLSQSNTRVKIGMGNGTSSITDYYVEFEEREVSANFHVDRLKSNIRNVDFEFKSNNRYDQYFQSIGSIISANANGMHINVKEGLNGILVDIGKISISINNWDLFVDQNGPEDMPTFSWKLDVQNAVVTPSTGTLRELGDKQWEIFNYLAGGTGSITIKKVSGNVSMKQNGKISAKGNLMLPVGKVNVDLLATIDRDLKSEPYINSLKFDLTNLPPEVKAFLNDLILNEDIPLRKSGNGFSLKMSGSFNNPRFR